ncbi:hypothetical protein [Flexivirga oryzae]|uniref:WxL domain-containing protein n=1 Tax=Flexivirga oryzae TaxID=1794944 RepID=A0A839NEG0_9MICO|nr:hypothetical protein [Flexivirga oryzae]MBB2893545.1 hypothetical protein [Flexivirga oryzae]
MRRLRLGLALASVLLLVTVPGAHAATRTAGPIPAATLSSMSWTASSQVTGATGVSYTYKFTTGALSLAVTSVTMTVPPGTSGTPAVGSVSPTSLAGGTVTLSGNTLTYTTVSLVLVSTAVSIQITGLTNTATAGSYTSTVTTRSLLGTTVDSGTTPALTFAGTLSVTSPASLAWAATLTGTDQTIGDTRATDQHLTANDNTGSGSGWHITAAATTPTSGRHSIAGGLLVNGSLTASASTSAPSASCVTTCTLPTNTTTYPVTIPTATSPTPVTIYTAAAGTGRGQIRLGGNSAANPFGWWIRVPGNAYVGTYTTTMTIATVSGP